MADAKGVIVGHASLIANPKALRRKHAAGLGMAIHHQWQRQGIATEMLRLLIDAADNLSWMFSLTTLEQSSFMRSLALNWKVGIKRILSVTVVMSMF